MQVAALLVQFPPNAQKGAQARAAVIGDVRAVQDYLAVAFPGGGQDLGLEQVCGENVDAPVGSQHDRGTVGLYYVDIHNSIPSVTDVKTAVPRELAPLRRDRPAQSPVGPHCIPLRLMVTRTLNGSQEKPVGGPVDTLEPDRQWI